MFIDDKQAGEAHFPVTVPMALGIGSGIRGGRLPGSPVSVMYRSPVTFSRTITSVAISGDSKTLHDDNEAKAGQARVAMARQ